MLYNIYVRISILISSLLIIVGIAYAILAIKFHRRSRYLFFAALFLETGMFLLLSILNIVHIDFPEAWPLLPIFTGIALFVSGWHRYRAIRPSYIILSTAFIILGAIMMVFALDLLSFTLAQFVSHWWLLLVLLSALALTLIFLAAKYDKKNNRI